MRGDRLAPSPVLSGRWRLEDSSFGLPAPCFLLVQAPRNLPSAYYCANRRARTRLVVGQQAVLSSSLHDWVFHQDLCKDPALVAAPKLLRVAANED